MLLRDGGIVALICLAQSIDRSLTIQLDLIAICRRSLNCGNRCLDHLGTVFREVCGSMLRSEEVEVAIAT